MRPRHFQITRAAIHSEKIPASFTAQPREPFALPAAEVTDCSRVRGEQAAVTHIELPELGLHLQRFSAAEIPRVSLIEPRATAALGFGIHAAIHCCGT
jgi:hypothetical protein